MQIDSPPPAAFAPPAPPAAPGAAALALRPLPLAPVSVALTALARRVARANPGLFGRLGVHAGKRFVLDPTDLPLALCLRPDPDRPVVEAHRRAPAGDVRIAGTLGALLALVHGSSDGDALFFSRDLGVEGDTAAALALRNAVDNAELDLAAEAAALSGPFAPALRRMIEAAERATGLALTRPPEEPVEW